jgi:regulator of sigma E protease
MGEDRMTDRDPDLGAPQVNASPPRSRLPSFFVASLILIVVAVLTGQLPAEALVTIFLFFLILGVTVVIHELGHFVAARLANVHVLEFGIGFPPRAKVLRDQGETVYTLNWLPIGGFVKLEGEDGDGADDPRSFAGQRLPIKLLILVAGVAMNLVLAFAIFTAITLTGDPATGIYIPYVDPASPAADAGLVVGDVIERVDGRAFGVFGPTSILQDLSSKAGRSVSLRVRHADGSVADLRATLRTLDELKANPDLGALGIGRKETKDPVTGEVIVAGIPLESRVTDDRITYPVGTAIRLGFDRTVTATQLIFAGVGELVSDLITRPTEPPAGAAGPVGIAIEIGNVFWTLGPIVTLYLAGILSANLAVVNILPFPPLDGGRMFVLLLKSVLGRRLSLRVERLTYVVGFALLFAFLIWVTAFDVIRQLDGTR